MKTSHIPDIILPVWPVAASVCACSTTRIGGVSQPPFNSFNLGIRTTDARGNVLKNRALLQDTMSLPTTPCWLWQVHGTRVVEAGVSVRDEKADALWTQHPNVVCAVVSADCLPVLLADRGGGCVAAAHVGWRGLLDGVVEAVIDALPVSPQQLCAWLGPSIGPQAFVVGAAVYTAFSAQNPAYRRYFQTTKVPGKWLADLPGLARQRLQQIGVKAIFGGQWCTYTDRRRFFSHRRDGGQSGRMATLIWLAGGGLKNQ